MTPSVAIWSWLGLWFALVWLMANALRLVPVLRAKHALSCGVAMICAALITQIRWFGYPLQFWSASLAANFSVVLISLFLVWAAGELTGRKYFRMRDWRAAWIFGSISSVMLYPSALGLGPRNFDAYSLGWPWSGVESLLLFGAVTVCTAFLFLRGNRFGVVLLLATLGYVTQFQESLNYWDYILDPVYGAASLVGLIYFFLQGFAKRRMAQPFSHGASVSGREDSTSRSSLNR